MNPAAERPELIIHVAAEGGGIRLVGVERNGVWRFRRHVSDWTPELLDEPWVAHDTSFVEGWTAALELLDEYPWVRLAPRSVHPRFKAAVIEAVRSRFAAMRSVMQSRLAAWEEICR